MIDASLSRPWMVEREGNDTKGCGYEPFERLPGPDPEGLDDLDDVPSYEYAPVLEDPLEGPFPGAGQTLYRCGGGMLPKKQKQQKKWCHTFGRPGCKCRQRLLATGCALGLALVAFLCWRSRSR